MIGASRTNVSHRGIMNTLHENHFPSCCLGPAKTTKHVRETPGTLPRVSPSYSSLSRTETGKTALWKVQTVSISGLVGCGISAVSITATKPCCVGSVTEDTDKSAYGCIPLTLFWHYFTDKTLRQGGSETLLRRFNWQAIGSTSTQSQSDFRV